MTRILALGGSTTFGFPERPAGTRPTEGARYGFLGAVQAALDGGRPGAFEVVNLGVEGGMSEDTLRLGRRALSWGVDAVVVYDGHNEFMNVPEDFSPGLWDFALYRRLLLLAPRVLVSPGPAGPAAYGGPAQRAAVEARFAANLDTLVELLRDEGLPVILVTQAANLLFDPAWSVTADPSLLTGLAALDDTALAGRWIAHRDVADVAMAAGVRLGEREALLDAVDADPMPMRASRAINQTIRDVATRRGAILVEGFDAVGDATYYDNVHPEPEAARRLAQVILNGLVRAGVLDATVPAVIPARTVAERGEAERRAAAYWLRQACIRAHDPAFRLEQAVHHADAALALQPQDLEAAALRALAAAVPVRAPIHVEDPVLRARVAGIHPSLAALVR